MKKIHDLKAERAELIEKMEAITANETLTDEQRSEYTGFDDQIKKIDEDIALLERQNELNKNKVETRVENTEKKPIGTQFRDWLFKSVEEGGKAPAFRADPIISSTDSAEILKTVADGVDILVSPAEAALRQLGVQFLTGLTGNVVIPRMDQDLAAFPGENTGAASANMAPSSLTLAARRVSHTQSISKETLAQTNPGLYSSILANLYNGIYNAVANDVFDTLQTDAAVSQTGAGITYASIAQMEASVGVYSNIGSMAFVTTPTNRATLKTTAKMANQAPIWGDDNMVLGYPAYALPAANDTMLYLGDFSKMVVGQWGALEVIVDPYTNAKKGLIDLTIVGMFDSGCTNPKGLVWCANA